MTISIGAGFGFGMCQIFKINPNGIFLCSANRVHPNGTEIPVVYSSPQ